MRIKKKKEKKNGEKKTQRSRLYIETEGDRTWEGIKKKAKLENESKRERVWKSARSPAMSLSSSLAWVFARFSPESLWLVESMKKKEWKNMRKSGKEKLENQYLDKSLCVAAAGRHQMKMRSNTHTHIFTV